MSSPPGFSDESSVADPTGPKVRHSKRSNKNQGPKRLGSPIKHSVKETTTDEDIADPNQLALEAYRQKLANLKTETDKPMETRLGPRTFGEAFVSAKIWIRRT